MNTNELNTLLPIVGNQTLEGEIQTVNARDLYKFLESRQDFSTWAKKRITDGNFTEGLDYLRLHEKMEANNATRIEYYVSLDVAKHIAMLERNEKGHEARKYFIECEKALQNVHYDLIPKTLPEALEAYAKEIRAHQQTQALLEEAKPKVEFYDLAMETESTVDMKQAAKILDLDFLGRNRLFAYLRSKGILDAKNQPYQEYIDKGWFKLVQYTVPGPYGNTRVKFKTVCYQKGLDLLLRVLTKKGYQRL